MSPTQKLLKEFRQYFASSYDPLGKLAARIGALLLVICSPKAANRVSRRSRSQIHELERALTEFEKLAEEHELPREIRQALHQMMRRRRGSGLSEDALLGQGWTSSKSVESYERTGRTVR